MTVLVVKWEDLPEIPKVETKWLDERELCPLVQRYAHGGKWAHPEERCKCADYSIGICHRAGGQFRVNCAFDDDNFAWSKARDWEPVAGGGYFFNPRSKRSNGNGTNGNGKH